MKTKFKLIITNLFLTFTLFAKFANANLVFAEVEILNDQIEQTEAAVSTETTNLNIGDLQGVESNQTVDAAELTKWDNLSKKLFGEESLLKDCAWRGVNGLVGGASSVVVFASIMKEEKSILKDSICLISQHICEDHNANCLKNEACRSCLLMFGLTTIVSGISSSVILEAVKRAIFKNINNENNIKYLLKEDLETFPAELQEDIELIKSSKDPNVIKTKLLEVYKKVLKNAIKKEISKKRKAVNIVSKLSAQAVCGIIGFLSGFAWQYLLG